MSSQFQQARLAVVGCEMVARSLRLILAMASADLARVRVSTQAALGGTESGTQALGHFADCAAHLRSALSSYQHGRREVKVAVTQIHQL